ncbi:MAG: hypothetical protein ICV54_20975 [Nostoc sp. C3-bin3]|nr:hypothetical protein [Nostoc sp. C3-bin3]
MVKNSHSSADKKIIYPLLQDNLEKLDLNFADLLRRWSKKYFAGESLYKAQTVAGTISSFGILIGQLPQGNLANK